MSRVVRPGGEQTPLGVSLLSIYETLKGQIVPSDPDALNGCELPGYPRYHAAVDSSYHPVFLVEEEGKEFPSPIPIVLQNLSVDYGAHCSLRLSKGLERRSRFSVLRCLSPDRSLQRHFIAMVESLIGVLGKEPSPLQIQGSVQELVDLFKAMTASPVKSAQGLWAELFVIDRARNPRLMANAWHATPKEVWDFDLGPQRLEVKSSSTQHRRHPCSWNQLHPPSEVKVVIASVYALRAANGLSVAALLGRIRDRLGDPQLARRIELIALESLGSDWADAYNMCFDVELASSSVAFFDAACVPSIAGPLPVGVSDVHLVSDVSLASPLTSRQLALEGDMFEAVVGV